MDDCRKLRRCLLISLCCALVISGQLASFPATRTSNDAEQSVRRYDAMASAVLCVPNRFQHQIQSLLISAIDLSPSLPVPMAVQEALGDSSLQLATMRQIWNGPPPLRSPPLSIKRNDTVIVFFNGDSPHAQRVV